MLKGLTQYRDFGLLLLRTGIGLTYIFVHGGPKLFEGSARWQEVGYAISSIGIEFGFVFWGFMAALAEFVGGILLLMGFLFRPALIFLFISMFVATITQIQAGEPWGPVVSHPLKMAVLFLSLMLIGPGKYSVDKK